MGRYKTLGTNAIYITIGTFGSKFITFLMLPLYTKWLSVNDYGLTDILNVYATLISCLATLALSEAIFVFPVNHNKENQSRYFSTGLIAILGLSFTCATIFGIIQYIYGIYSQTTDTFIENIWLIFLLYITTSLQAYLQQFCRSINKLRTFCYAGIIYTGFTAILSFILTPRYGVIGFVYSYANANLLSAIFIIISEKIYEYFKWKLYDFDKLKEMLGYSIPLIPNSVMWWVLSAINRPLLDSYLGLSAIGLFAVACKFPSIISSLCGIFNSSWQISVLQEYRKENFSNFYNNIGLAYFSTLILLSSIMAICGKSLLALFVDAKFADASTYIPILSFSVVFTGMSSHYGTIFSAEKKSIYFLISSMCGAISSILGNIILIPLYGIWGAAVTFSLSQLVICLIRLYYNSKFIAMHGLSYIIYGCLFNLSIIILLLTDKQLLALIVFIVMTLLIMSRQKKYISLLYSKLTTNKIK